jgi:hypothetical protein
VYTGPQQDESEAALNHLSRTFLLACGAVIGSGALSAAIMLTGPSTLNLVEGAVFNGTIGTFTDTNTNQPLSNYSVDINWGDGTTTSATITGGSGSFTILGTHTYADERTTPFVTSLSLTDTDGESASATGSANVIDAPLNLVSSLPSFSFLAGVPVNLLFGGFGDANPLPLLSEFAVTINWGDGTTTPGTITLGSNNFQVLGGHTYTNAINFVVSVGINDDGGSQLSFRTNALGAVPEPGSLAMVVIGLGSLAAMARRRRPDRQGRVRKR